MILMALFWNLSTPMLCLADELPDQTGKENETMVLEKNRSKDLLEQTPSVKDGSEEPAVNHERETLAENSQINEMEQVEPEKESIPPAEEKVETETGVLPDPEDPPSSSMDTESVPTEEETISSGTETIQPPAASTPQGDAATESFLLKIGEPARKIASDNDLYASVMLAQAILESGSGNSRLAAAPNFNLFGIKGEHNGNFVFFQTQEDDGTGNLYTTEASFKRYTSYVESLQDYAELLREGTSWNTSFYQGAWKSQTNAPHEATAFLQGRYATDIHYAEKLDQLMEVYQLTRYDEPISEGAETDKGKAVQAEALGFLDVPYVWGGSTPEGFDCSGLVQVVFKNSLNLDTGRVTTEQEQKGAEVSLDSLHTGDLLFWGQRGATTHVAIYLGDQQFIHAPTTGEVVKITSLSEHPPDFARRIIE